MRFFRRRKTTHEIAPDEIFLDSSNLPGHNASQFEGRVVRALSSRAVIAVGLVFILIALAFGVRAFSLEVVDGAEYADVSRNNTLDRTIVFATRGLILDRNGRELAWNEVESGSAASSSVFALRKYTALPGLAHVLGFIQYPKADSKGNWWREEFVGKSGVELAFNGVLRGINGSSMVETDARQKVQRENIVEPAEHGVDLTLSIDADVQSALYRILSQKAREQNYQGGAAVIMDVRTGALLAITSFPEYDNDAFNEGDTAVVRATLTDPRTPLLDRAISGQYAPGSIMKLIFAAAALNEHIISPDKKILSTGAIKLPNPYDSAHPSIFPDWTVHGWIDLREAIAVSSDEYFYTVGGGFGDILGLGIQKIAKYLSAAFANKKLGIDIGGEEAGFVPTPEWKERTRGEPWYQGDTYNTSIGQGDLLVTPLWLNTYVSAVANGGTIWRPQVAQKIITTDGQELQVFEPQKLGKLPFDQASIDEVHSDMRETVLTGTAKLLQDVPVAVSAKTGTAEVIKGRRINALFTAFAPSDNPTLSITILVEGSASNEGYAIRVANTVLKWWFDPNRAH